jgi:two-component system chemotaxis sensor kinase CheA
VKRSRQKNPPSRFEPGADSTVAQSAGCGGVEAAGGATTAAASELEAKGPDAASPDRTSSAAPEELPTLTAVPGSDNTLRVDAEKIDNVLNLVGELILAKSMWQQMLHEFARRFPKDDLHGKFSDVMAFQARALNDLQRSVMKIRMVPVEQLFRRFPRVVRDVARQSGKDIALVVKGVDTDLDKRILDALAEPLTHLVRNAIGHGIESAEERVRAGKRAQGTLRLNAYHQGNQVVIEVSDDGHGIAVEKVRQRALSQGLLSAEEADLLSDAQTLDMIFRPGFSTAAEITELSGRGVGLDVVQSVIERLKGTVQIETEVGRGTTFRLRLPLTLAIIKALLFGVERRLYAIPLNSVAEIARTVEAKFIESKTAKCSGATRCCLSCASGRPARCGIRRAQDFVLVTQRRRAKFGLINRYAGRREGSLSSRRSMTSPSPRTGKRRLHLGDGWVVLILGPLALVERHQSARQRRR